MPLNTGSLPPTLSYPVKAIEQNLLTAMGNCRDSLARYDGATTAALARWFGDNSPPFAKIMKEKIAKMRSVLNAQSIECTTTMLGGNQNENASATHFTTGIFGGASSSRVGKMTSTQTKLNVSPHFAALPPTAIGAAAAWTGQDKLETLLHELSHFVFATGDELLNDGVTIAYGGANARLLATQSVLRAKNNAENWGFFIEELG